MKKLVPLFLLLVLFVVGCGPEGPITITTSDVSPAINSFEADPATIAAGESATLKWSVSGATKVNIDQRIGDVALSGSRVVMPDTTTVYTLTATNTVGMSATATAQVIVTGEPAPAPTPTPAPAVLPVINYFIANPPAISVGDSVTLGWNVSSATSVTIDHGVGPVDSGGTAIVSPATSTNYTLTATNAAGVVYMTIPILVTGAPAAGMPDLVVTDILRSGDTISYTIENQGDAVAGASTSTLLVDGAVVANDGVGSLASGESKTEDFTAYTYTCTLPGDALEVRADTGGAVTESSEANNSYSESRSCFLVGTIVGPIYALKLPDLVVEDIWEVPEITGNKIYYKIKNIGSADSIATTSELYIFPCFDSCPPVATDTVDPLGPGESRTEKFGAYNYTGGGWSVGVKVDATGATAEWDEDNNTLSKSKGDL